MIVSDSKFDELENAVYRALAEIDRLRSINAELVAALQNLVALDQHEREAKATSYANGSPASKAWGEARAALERAKQ